MPRKALNDHARNVVRLLDRLLSRPGAAPLTYADDLVVTSPAGDTVWTVGSRRRVTWRTIGVVGRSVDLELVTGDGARARTVAFLAVDVPPRTLGATVTVPDAPEGTYRVRVTSEGDALDVYSRPVRITSIHG
ncbi:Ser-Thr-rich GPI-anchored membrane family protein [Streptomyces sp. NPDC093225]|uniref:Ser-Thr-rich GPI-anchored membrane family protein n=1 Tax=Streptomyces sp. NPDC093225 TaxID=3366034 RepID=UPI0038304BE1